MDETDVLAILDADRLARNCGHKLRLIEDLKAANNRRGEDVFELLCRMSRDPMIRDIDRPGIEEFLTNWKG